MLASLAAMASDNANTAGGSCPFASGFHSTEFFQPRFLFSTVQPYLVMMPIQYDFELVMFKLNSEPFRAAVGSSAEQMASSAAATDIA